MSVTLSWANPNPPTMVEDGINIYRSTDPISESALPSPLVQLEAGLLEYADETAVDGGSYYYRVGYVRQSNVYLSDELYVTAPSGTYPNWVSMVSGSAAALAVVGPDWRTVVGISPSYVYGAWYSSRKMLIALVLMRFKATVLDTEAVIVTAEDIASTSGEWLSGLAAGDSVTWRDILNLMLVPSKSDIAATVERVLGAELLASYHLGSSAREAIAIAMEQEAQKAGCLRPLCMAASSLVSGETVNELVLASCDDMARIIQRVYRNTTLRAIMQQTSITVTVTTGTAKTLTLASMDRVQGALDTSGTSTGAAPARYGIGKTGDVSDGSGHQTFCWTTLSGKIASGSVRAVSSRVRRQMCVLQTIMAAESLIASFRGAETAADPQASSVALRVVGTAVADVSVGARTLTNVGISIEASDYMLGQALVFASGDYATVAEPLELGSGDFTIEAFIQGSGSAQGDFISQWKTVTGGRGFEFGVDTTQVYFYVSTTGSDSSMVAVCPIPTTYVLQNGGPMHVCAQRSGSSLRVFVNGVPGPSYNIGSSAIYSPASTPTVIGGRMSSAAVFERGFVGKMDELIVTKGMARYGMKQFIPVYRNMRWN